jgi:small subunit ribosomal protein S1
MDANAEPGLQGEKQRDVNVEGKTREGWEAYDFASLYEESLQDIREGNIVTGEVIKIEKGVVYVDIGYKTEGGIPLSEFQDLTVREGDKVDVVLVRRADENGYPVLSRRRIQDVKQRNLVEQAFSEGHALRGTIISQVKGGYIVDIGMRAFLPASLVDFFPSGDASEWINTEHDFRIISYDRREGNIVVSRRAVLEEEREEQRQETLEQIQEGAVLQGVIRKVMEYGLLVDLGAVFGLVHITNLSWGKTRDIFKSFHPGEQVKVKVLGYSTDKQRVSLGIKQLYPDPWPEIEKKYPVGTRIEAPVVALKKYGVFVEVEEGIEGLIPTSELSWTRKVAHPSQVLNLGDVVEALVTGVDPRKRQISLSKKDAEPNRWDTIEKRFPIGTVIEGRVRKVMDFGIFIGIDEGIDGLVHQSDMTWEDPPPHPKDVFEVDQEVQAVVLSIDREKQHFTLSIKHLSPKE